MMYALNDPLASMVFIDCFIVLKLMLKCILLERKRYIYIIDIISNYYNMIVHGLRVLSGVYLYIDTQIYLECANNTTAVQEAITHIQDYITDVSNWMSRSAL